MFLIKIILHFFKFLSTYFCFYSFHLSSELFHYFNFNVETVMTYLRAFVFSI